MAKGGGAFSVGSSGISSTVVRKGDGCEGEGGGGGEGEGGGGGVGATGRRGRCSGRPASVVGSMSKSRAGARRARPARLYVGVLTGVCWARAAWYLG